MHPDKVSKEKLDDANAAFVALAAACATLLGLAHYCPYIVVLIC